MAKRFRFSLQTLLEVRRLREREAERQVAAQNAEIARVDRLNEQTTEEIGQQQAMLLEAQQRGELDPQALQRGRAWIAHLRRTIGQRQQQRAELVERLHELQTAWREARTQTRVIDKLRERRRTEHVRKEDRKEQAAADELAQQLQGYEWI